MSSPTSENSAAVEEIAFGDAKPSLTGTIAAGIMGLGWAIPPFDGIDEDRVDEMDRRHGQVQAIVDAALTAHPSAAAGDGGDWAAQLAYSVLRSHGVTPEFQDAVAAELRRIEATGYTRGYIVGQRPAPAQAPEAAGGDLEELRRLLSAMRSAENLYRLGSASYAGMASAGNAFNTAANAYVRKLLTTPSPAPGGPDRERMARATKAVGDVLCDLGLGLAIGVGAFEKVAVAALGAAGTLTPQPASPDAGEREQRLISPKLSPAQMERMAFNLADEFGSDFVLANKGFALAVYAEAYASAARVIPPTGPDAAGAAGEGWQPIETAPRDATVQVVVVPRGDPKTYSTSTEPATFPAYIDEDGQICCPGRWKPDLGLNGPAWRAILWRPLAAPPALAALPAASGAGEDAGVGVGR